MSGITAVCRDDLKVSCGTVHRVRVQHVKLRKRKSLSVGDLQLLRSIFDKAEFTSSREFTKQIVSPDPMHRIVHTVCLRDNVSNEHARLMGAAKLDEFFGTRTATTAHRAPKFDKREPRRRDAAKRGQPASSGHNA